MRRERILLIGLLFAACLHAHAADHKFIVKPRPQRLAALPFSDGVLVGNTLYIASGEIEVPPSALVSSTVEGAPMRVNRRQ